MQGRRTQESQEQVCTGPHRVLFWKKGQTDCYNTNNGSPKEFLPSPVHALLREWTSYPESTVGILMSKLRELGRRDAADFLLKASSVFKINLDGNGQEAYASSCNSGTSYNSISSVVSR